jgi:hypothetical protein
MEYAMKHFVHRTNQAILVFALLLVMIGTGACEFSLQWLYVPTDKIDPEVKALAERSIRAAHEGDAKTIAEISMFPEYGKYRKSDVESIEEGLEAAKGFWNYEDYSIDAGYTPRQAPGTVWRIVFTLYHKNDWSTKNEMYIRRFDGVWKVSDRVTDPKVLRNSPRVE